MTRADRAEARRELTQMFERAQALADKLDPKRTFTSRDEAKQTVIKAADRIAAAAKGALSILDVIEGRS